jgi:replicative DNA helicase
MPANAEYQLLSKIIEDGELSVAIEEGITEDYFGVVEARSVFAYLMDYFQSTKTRSLVPERDLVEGKFPTVELPTPSDRTTVKALCQEVREEYLRVKMEDIMNQAIETYDEEPHFALTRLIQDAKTLQETSEESRDLILADSTESMKREYLMVQEARGMLGIPWPVGWGYHTDNGRPKILKKTGRQHHPLNEQSGGMRGGDFILLYGRPKSMKTWALVDMTVECYQHLNQRTLVFTKEMTPEQLRWRIVARMLGVDYTLLKSGMLPEEEREEFLDLMDTMKSEEERLVIKGHNRSMMITTGWKRGSAQSGIHSLQSKIEEFEPDIVMADSVYLMNASRKKDGGSQWQDIAEIAYGLKELALEYKIPVVATSQANRRGEELKGTSLAEIAYGDTFGQACDYAIRIIKTEDEDGRFFMSFIFAGAREIKLPGFRLEVDCAKKFQLDQMFESQRQIMAQFKAEEEAIAREEEEAARKINKDRGRRLDPEKFNERGGG